MYPVLACCYCCLLAKWIRCRFRFFPFQLLLLRSSSSPSIRNASARYPFTWVWAAVLECLCVCVTATQSSVCVCVCCWLLFIESSNRANAAGCAPIMTNIVFIFGATESDSTVRQLDVLLSLIMHSGRNMRVIARMTVGACRNKLPNKWQNFEKKIKEKKTIKNSKKIQVNFENGPSNQPTNQSLGQ